MSEHPPEIKLTSHDTLASGETWARGATLTRGSAPAPASREAPEISVVVRTGQTIGRYFVIRELGAGGMGVVYEAYDHKLDRKVALKLLLARGTHSARKRLEREAQALAKLAHPHVVAVYDVDVHDEQLFVAMELVAGQTLGAWMGEASRGGEPRPWPEVLAHFMEAGSGLASAHAAGLIHRDFKPENVMLGDDGRARVMDFGLARPEEKLVTLESESGSGLGSVKELPFSSALAVPMTRTGALMGTPAYMAPEQFEGHADGRSDQFAFCVALYEALYARRPFQGETIGELLDAMRAGPRVPPATSGAAPAWLYAAVARGLAEDPEGRWPSMGALLEALGDDPAHRRRRWAVRALIGGLSAGVVGALSWASQAQPQVEVQAPAPACVGFEEDLSGVWDEAREAQVRGAIEATGLTYAASTWERVEGGLDGYAAAWVRARRDSCEASQRGEQSGELLDLRMACLDDRLRHLEATVDVLAEVDEAVLGKAGQLVAGLPGLDRCADAEALSAELPPPEDPALASQVAALDERLIQAQVLRQAGRYAEGGGARRADRGRGGDLGLRAAPGPGVGGAGALAHGGRRVRGGRGGPRAGLRLGARAGHDPRGGLGLDPADRGRGGAARPP